jgi:hypothetical protein
VKICKDCAHYGRSLVDSYRFDKCFRLSETINNINGLAPNPFFCTIERSETAAMFGGCGPSGRFFTPRPVVPKPVGWWAKVRRFFSRPS